MKTIRNRRKATAVPKAVRNAFERQLNRYVEHWKQGVRAATSRTKKKSKRL
jgi:hypothetical protein